MAANRQTAATPGAPRDGSALLSGLLRCGRCGGHRMTARYHDGPGAARPAHSYTCAFYQANYGTGGPPAHRRPPLDDWVARQVLDAVAPAGAGSLHGRRRPGRGRAGHAGQAVAPAAGARPLRRRPRPPPVPARRAREPARRPAAGSRRKPRSPRRPAWKRATSGSPRTAATLTAAERAAIQDLARDLPRVWSAPSTTQADRKGLLRILIEDITATVAGDSELVDVTITWAGVTSPPARPSAPSPAWTSCRTIPHPRPRHRTRRRRPQ